MATVALIGNPNTGKTTLFNSLTDKYEYVGNWTRVTVEKKQGLLKGTAVTIIDLPGVYSLDPLTKDEAVVANYLMHNQPNMILNVTNASQLRRTGYDYDRDVLQKRLGCPVITTNARNHKEIVAVRDQVRHCEQQSVAPP